MNRLVCVCLVLLHQESTSEAGNAVGGGRGRGPRGHYTLPKPTTHIGTSLIGVPILFYRRPAILLE